MLSPAASLQQREKPSALGKTRSERDFHNRKVPLYRYGHHGALAQVWSVRPEGQRIHDAPSAPPPGRTLELPETDRFIIVPTPDKPYRLRVRFYPPVRELEL